MSYQRFEDLPVWQEAARLYELTEDLLEDSGLRATRGFRDQLDRAALSVSNNIAEGFERGTTPDRINFLYIAKGSAGEVRSMLTVKLRRLRKGPVADRMEAIRASAESCARQLGGWADNLQNSDIKGQRHLNDSARDQYRKTKEREAGEKQWQEARLQRIRNLPDDHHLKIEARRKGEI
jgi:four helix bundle protein